MAVKLKIDKNQQCVGCRQCETTCSIAHTGVFSPWHSRVQVLRIERTLECTPVICRQCKKAKCAEVCPVGAIRPDENNVLRVDETACIGCQSCVDACPFHAMRYHTEEEVAFKCDLCGGEVLCAKVCPAHVLIRSEE